MFKKKVEKPPVIKFYTHVEGMIDLVPPVPMRKAMPEWIKKTPLRCPVEKPELGPYGQPMPQAGPPKPANTNMPDGMTTIKACAGVIDIMRWGWMVPMWADHTMTTFPDSNETGRYSARPSIADVKTSGFRAEHQELMPQMKGEYDWAVKFDSPWLIETPPGYSVALLPLPFADKEFEQPWRVVQGIIDTDRYHNFNVLLKWRYDGEYLIEQGTPMCVVVPFKRADADMDYELIKIDEKEHARLRAKGKGGTGTGDRFITMPYQRWRKQCELAEKEKG